jgi:hypothetical protein
MGFNLLILQRRSAGGLSAVESWPDRLRAAIPDITVNVAASEGEAMELIGDADAAFGDISPELLARARETSLDRLSAGWPSGRVLP